MNKGGKMKKIVVLICVLTLLACPVVSFADDAASAAGEKPVQVLKQGYVASGLKEPSTVDWSTGKGRKDGVLEWAVDDNYLKKFPGMFLRGFSNTGFGWAEILTHPIRWSKNAPLGVGTLAGLIVGPVVGVLRTASGVIDLGTFWIPFWYGIPMEKPALGLHDIENYGTTIEDVYVYDMQVKRYFFSKLSDQY